MDGRAPVAPGVREPCPQEAVGRRETKTWAPRSMDDGELVSERDDLQMQQGARLDQEAKGVKERDDDATTAGYRRTRTTSIDATRTEFSVGTAI